MAILKSMDSRNSTSHLPTVPLWINGVHHQSQYVTSPERLFPVVSAKTRTIIHFAVSATPLEAVIAADAASSAFIEWRRTSPTYRRNIILKAAEIYETRAEEIASCMVAETSCPKPFASFNVSSAAKQLREIAAASAEIRGTVTQRDTDAYGLEEAGLTVVLKQPIGPVLVIPP